MKTLTEVEERTHEIRLRALKILGEFRINSDNPQKIMDLADELRTLMKEYEASVAALEQIQAVGALLLNENCSGPH